MLPPVLDIFVVWHPDDVVGELVAGELLDHFHGTVFTGLIGGAVEVYVRSQGWRGKSDKPRALPLPGTVRPAAPGAPHYVAVVPVLGIGLAEAVRSRSGPWWEYLSRICEARSKHPDRVRIMPLLGSAGLEKSALLQLFDRLQRIGSVSPATPRGGAWLRDLVQALAQFVQGPGVRLQVFISHTRQGTQGGESARHLTSTVRSVIAETRLAEFFDAHDLQPGEEWRDALRLSAGKNAVLALRTDRYASRSWCQEEVLAAKQAGAPVVILDALENGEERGSFLLDHVPRVPVRRSPDGWSRIGVEAGLGLILDETLKRGLWRKQEALAVELGRRELDVAWWAPHAPEPATLTAWLLDHPARLTGDVPLRVLHPDPPLRDPELRVLAELARLAGFQQPPELMTPRQLAARGG